MNRGVGLERSERETERFGAGEPSDPAQRATTYFQKDNPFTMPLKFFHISSRDSAPMEAELNSFISRHRIVTIERRFVEQGMDSFWALCVDFLHGEPGTGATHGAPGRSERKVDYKEVLKPEEFEVFSKLRDLRKQIADKEAVPVYAVFTNEQLAAGRW